MTVAPTARNPFLTTRLSDRAIALLLGLGALLLTGPLIYQSGLGEPDSTAMAVGVFQAKLSGRGLSEPFLYAPEVQPLYYLLLFALGGPGLPYDAIVQLMNLISWVANACNVLLIFCLVRRTCGVHGATLVAVTLLSTPIFIDLSTYGHPVTPATSVLLGGTALVFRSQQPLDLPRLRSAGALLCAWALLVCSLLIRIDGILLFPGLLALAWLLAGRRVAVSGGVLMFSAGVVSLGVQQFMAMSGQSSGILALYLPLLIPDANVMERILHAFPPMVAACGLGTLGLIGGVIVLSARKRIVPALWVAPLLLVPGLLHGFASPEPMRHFWHFVVGGVLLLGFLFSRLPVSLGSRRLWALATPTVLLNVVLVVSLQRLLPEGFVSQHVHRRLQPMMISVFSRQRTNEQYHQWDEARWHSLLRESTQDGLFVGTWCDLVGLRQEIARSGRYHEVLADQRWTIDKFVTFRLGDVPIQFVEYYGYGAFRPPPATHPIQTLVLLAEYPQNQFERFRLKRYYTPLATSWYF